MERLAVRHGLLVLAALASITLTRAARLPQVASDVSPEDASALRDIVASGRLSDLRWPDFSDYRDQVASFYGPTAYAPAWIADGRPAPPALSLIERFKDAWKDGLQPEDYDASRWDGRLRDLKDGSADPARFDVAMTVCAMRYVSGLRSGRINPRHFRFGLSVEAKRYDLARFLRERLLTASLLSPPLDGVEPSFADYRRTRAALARYVRMARADDGEALPTPAKPVHPGEPYAGAPLLYRRLALVGDLRSAAIPEAEPRVYDGVLAKAVRRFQYRHGLETDGLLGPETVKQLNVPLSDRVRQLELALERWRWLPAEFSFPPIVVNIPGFRLRAFDDDDRVALEMRVVVGKALCNETPVFSAEMTYVVLRPYWIVPPGILRTEIVPAIERDRRYVAANRYEVMTPDGRVVTGGVISDGVLSQLKAGALSVRQKPGPTNALGLVKLMFPNEFDVYMHATPARALFSKSRRDFSHGCIRVEKPAELAAWALRNKPGWSLERVRSEMQTGPDDVTVNLAQPVPVFIVYATAMVDENDEVYFYEDIYGHDASLARALARGYPYP